jgi:4-amino-4-deoxy-L-arabinose transferase-like glycosyltransferase
MLAALGLVGTYAGVILLHHPLLHLPYFWDEAGYYVPAAWDIYRNWELVPTSTLPTGHTPLVMVYLAVAWQLFGFAPVVTRVAMALIAAATVVATYALARRVASREAAVWSALLLAISPMFFAQSTLVFLDLSAALFTTLAVMALVENRWWQFAVMASLAVLTKETGVVMLPVAWAYAWRRGWLRQAPALRRWMAMTVPLAPLVAWSLYYHHHTGFWTGNAEYLQFNLYSTLDPGRIGWTLLRRLYEVFVGGFNWVVVAGACGGALWKAHRRDAETRRKIRDFLVLATGIVTAYLLTLSVVGGAVLPRYLLPIFPVFFLSLVLLAWQLPKTVARGIGGVTVICFIAAWFINPPYPFAYENNLSYADFIRIHQDAARYLEARSAGKRVLTAWSATDELARPFLGYVQKPLSVVPLEGFTEKDFATVDPESFDLVYIYSRKWEPEANWLSRFPVFRRAQERHFGYAPQTRDQDLVGRYGLTLFKQFERRGQWARIYGKKGEIHPAPPPPFEMRHPPFALGR